MTAKIIHMALTEWILKERDDIYQTMLFDFQVTYMYNFVMLYNTLCVNKTFAHCNVNGTAGRCMVNSVCDNDFLLHDCMKKDNYLQLCDKSFRE
jgi:hypothetical protein